MTSPTNPIARLDVPQQAVEEQAVSCAVLRAALKATHSPSDALAYRLDMYLVTHPDAPVSTKSGDPAWDAWLADRIADHAAAWAAAHTKTTGGTA